MPSLGVVLEARSSVDPLASKYPGWSPYNYTLGNPLKYIDPDGKDVKAYGEYLNSNTSILASLSLSTHTFIYITTPTQNLTIELGGPRNGSAKGTPIMTLVDKKFDSHNGRNNAFELDVERPKGVGKNDYSFEYYIIKIFKVMENRLPDYNGLGPNSNGFAKFLIEAAGGKLDLNITAYFSSTEEYKEKYDEFLKKKQKEKKNTYKNGIPKNNGNAVRQGGSTTNIPY